MKKKLTCHCGSFEAEVEVPENGIEKIIELDLDSADLNHLTESAEGVSKTNSLLGL